MKSQIAAGASGLVLACALLFARTAFATPPAASIAGALADPRRPAAQVAADAYRKPADVLAFAGIRPGEKVADFMPGNAYYTRLVSVAVGPAGRVYGIIPAEIARNCEPGEIAGALQVGHDGSYRNVRILQQPVARFRPPEPVDVVFTALNYHDLFDSFMEHADVRTVDLALFRALKPGGVLVIDDHAAEAGSGLRDTETLHRIDPAEIKRRLQAVGFVLEAESPALRNPADDHHLRVFDPKIRGRTDQVLLRFRKPKA